MTMGKIIALQGTASTGKTTTMGIVRRMMLDNGFEPLPHHYVWFGDGGGQGGRDFRDVLIKKDQKYGITSAGDTRDLLREQIDFFVSLQCTIILCACRTRGGGVELLNEYVGYDPEFVPKHHTKNRQEFNRVNNQDAECVFLKITDEI